jgi:hypothetical protein
MVMIIVEGDDDRKFLIKLLNYLRENNKIDVEDYFNFNTIIETMGGKSKLLDHNQDRYKKLSKNVENKIEKVLFIFDCDFEKDDKKCNGMKKSEKCYNNLLQCLKWNIKTDVYIFNRNLDYFLMETIKDKNCYDDFEKLINCLGVEELKPNKKPIANLYRDLYPHPEFNFEDKNFNNLKDKLIALFTKE